MTKRNVIIGVSAFYHDSAAAIIIDGEIIAAAQEERFTRIKHDPAFPINAIKFVLSETGLSLSDVYGIAFYDKPYIKFERLLETYHKFAPIGLKSFIIAMPVWIKEKLFLKKIIRDELKELGNNKIPLFFPEHHLSHAASAYYPSPYNDSAILTIDGVGEWATTTISHGVGKNIELKTELNFPHSLGLLYSAFTFYCGFKVNSGEYKLMGLAPYGNIESEQTKKFIDLIYTYLVDVREDGSFILNMDYFNFAAGLTMTKDSKWKDIFGVARRDSESELTQDYMNLASAIQEVTEEIIFKLAITAKNLTGSKNLTLAGGVALNCVANGKLLRKKIFDNIWIQPAAGDAGGAVGAALAVWHISLGKDLIKKEDADLMSNSLLGPEFSKIEIKRALNKYQATSKYYSDFEELTSCVSEFLDVSKVVGWFQGKMEFGPRALCNRSILGDPRKSDMQKKLNLKIKFREGFRPFAPVILEEKIGDYFDLDTASPYMLIVAPVKENIRTKEPENFNDLEMYDRLYHCRSTVPAITHVDYSARIQSVNAESNNRMYKLLTKFESKTGCPLLVNTSFNVRGEPIVCTPDDAYRCFMRTEMDVLVLGNYILIKEEQPKWDEKTNWKETFKLD